jgi:Alcohol dehydrogenase GroES-like domain
MKAVVYERYGSPEVLHLTELAKPTPTDDQILIKIHAASLNGSDREGLIGRPLYARIGGLLRPRHRILGSDIAGRVESVGRNHTEFKPGDEVFGEIPGYHSGLAEYVRLHPWQDNDAETGQPDVEQAAAIPQAGVIALQGIREKGQVQPGQKVLINGAGGLRRTSRSRRGAAAPSSSNGQGRGVALTPDTGYFWFFDAANVEVVIKVLNGCGSNSRYWTFAGGLTDVNVILTVTDTQTGVIKTYTNPQGTPFQPIQDTDAFATCP